jgi:lysophospholipase L1-like esterase
MIEVGYRIVDPFPYYPEDEINLTQHGNLSQYDPLLGWKGVPDGASEFTTVNNSIWLAHNSEGFRDIEHGANGMQKPGIVFLGDSFTWGYEVEFDEMFVNLIRGKLPNYEIYNLSHRGYGTDQQLLTFKQWYNNQSLEVIVLMFSENDVEEIIADERYDKPKPQFQIIEGELVLTGVPVPEIESWTSSPAEPKSNIRSLSLKNFFYRSHFIHDIAFRIELLQSASNSKNVQRKYKPKELALTSRVLEALKQEVEMRGGKLVVFFIPSKRQVENLDDSQPYQTQIIALCEELGIQYFDLASDFPSAWPRSYYRYGIHWNLRGNQTTADAIYRHLTQDVIP